MLFPRKNEHHSHRAKTRASKNVPPDKIAATSHHASTAPPATTAGSVGATVFTAGEPVIAAVGDGEGRPLGNEAGLGVPSLPGAGFGTAKSGVTGAEVGLMPGARVAETLGVGVGGSMGEGVTSTTGTGVVGWTGERVDDIVGVGVGGGAGAEVRGTMGAGVGGKTGEGIAGTIGAGVGRGTGELVEGTTGVGVRGGTGFGVDRTCSKGSDFMPTKSPPPPPAAGEGPGGAHDPYVTPSRNRPPAESNPAKENQSVLSVPS